MSELAAALAGPWRLGVGVSLFVVLLAAELAVRAPRRPRDRLRRWPLNAAFFLVNAGLGRLLAGLGPIALAAWAQDAGVGLFNLMAAPIALAWIAAILALDLAIYWQHRALHEVGPLWRLHRVHHTDPTLDLTSGYRFHPAEIVFSLAVKGAVAVALGAPPEAVAAFEAILAAASLWTHADIRLGPRADRIARAVIVTPNAHEQHHDRTPEGQTTNYGGVITLWDRVFGTWRAPPRGGLETLGVAGVDAAAAARLGGGFLDPLRR